MKKGEMRRYRGWNATGFSLDRTCSPCLRRIVEVRPPAVRIIGVRVGEDVFHCSVRVSAIVVDPRIL